MSLSTTFVTVNNEEMLRKDFALKYFLEVKTVAIKTKTASMINHMLSSFFLELVIIYPLKS